MSSLPPPLEKREPLGEVSPGDQGRDEPDDLSAVGRAVAVDHHDNVASAGGESGPQGTSLAGSDLMDDLYIRAALFGDGNRVVYRAPVRQHDLVYPAVQGTKDDRQVSCLILDGYDHADGLRNGESRVYGTVLTLDGYCWLAMRAG